MKEVTRVILRDGDDRVTLEPIYEGLGEGWTFGMSQGLVTSPDYQTWLCLAVNVVERLCVIVDSGAPGTTFRWGDSPDLAERFDTGLDHGYRLGETSELLGGFVERLRESAQRDIAEGYVDDRKVATIVSADGLRKASYVRCGERIEMMLDGKPINVRDASLRKMLFSPNSRRFFALFEYDNSAEGSFILIDRETHNYFADNICFSEGGLRWAVWGDMQDAAGCEEYGRSILLIDGEEILQVSTPSTWQQSTIDACDTQGATTDRTILHWSPDSRWLAYCGFDFEGDVDDERAEQHFVGVTSGEVAIQVLGYKIKHCQFPETDRFEALVSHDNSTQLSRLRLNLSGF